MSHSDPELGLTVLGKIEILRYLGEVADELAVRHLVCRLVVVGGSYLALHDLRESTADVDSVSKLTDEVRAVVREVGQRHGLRADWLNDSAMTFAPVGLDLRRVRTALRTQQSHGRRAITRPGVLDEATRQPCT